MNVTIIGAAGQLGTDLVAEFPDSVQLTHGQIEITDADSVKKVLDAAGPDVVINTAAYNLVDQAEDEPQRAFAVNAEGPENLARWCAENDAKLVHVSTDYVFGQDATRTTSYTESDSPGPLGVYGQSKLAGERAVQQSGCRHLIIRTCGLYGDAATKSKGNFVKTMLRLADEREELRIVNDQQCTPSYTKDVAKMIAHLVRVDAAGLFHVTNSGGTSWDEFAREIFRLTGKSTRVVSIPSSEYPTKARRPPYSVLNVAKAEEATGVVMPDWRDALARFLS